MAISGEAIGTFLKMIIKNGGAQFVLTLLLAWLFREYFDIKPGTVALLLEWLLWGAFVQAVWRMITGEYFYFIQRRKDFKEGKVVATEKNGKSVSDMGKDIGLETVITVVEKASDLRKKIAETKDVKKKDEMLKELRELEEELAEIEREEV